MGRFNDAADLLKREAAKLEPYVIAAKALDEIGSLEQHQQDLTNQVASLMTAKDDLQKQIDEAQSIHSLTVSSTDSYVADKKTQIQEWAKQAQDEADAYKAKVIADAEADVAAKIKVSNDVLSGLESRMKDASAKLDEIVARVAKEEKKAADAVELRKQAEAALAQIKAQVANLAGN